MASQFFLRLNVLPPLAKYLFGSQYRQKIRFSAHPQRIAKLSKNFAAEVTAQPQAITYPNTSASILICNNRREG